MLQGVWRLRDQFTEACPSNHSLTTICWGPFYSEPYTKKCILEWKCWRQIESHVGTDTRITRSFFLLIKLPLLWCRGKSSCSWENGLLSFPILSFDSIFYFFSGKKNGLLNLKASPLRYCQWLQGPEARMLYVIATQAPCTSSWDIKYFSLIEPKVDFNISLLLASYTPFWDQD